MGEHNVCWGVYLYTDFDDPALKESFLIITNPSKHSAYKEMKRTANRAWKKLPNRNETRVDEGPDGFYIFEEDRTKMFYELTEIIDAGGGLWGRTDSEEKISEDENEQESAEEEKGTKTDGGEGSLFEPERPRPNALYGLYVHPAGTTQTILLSHHSSFSEASKKMGILSQDHSKSYPNRELRGQSIDLKGHSTQVKLRYTIEIGRLVGDKFMTEDEWLRMEMEAHKA